MSDAVKATLYGLGSLVGAFLCALIVAAGSTKWLPGGAAGIDHIVLPIIAFPLIWIAFALWLYGCQRRVKTWGYVGGITIAHLGLIVYGFAS